MNTYLKEELQAEGLVRKVPPLIRFLAVVGQINGQILNTQNISREASVARSTVGTYFAVLSDTLVGHILPAWRPGFKVREAARPKFYWFDPGVARAAAGLLRDPLDRLWQGTALETLLYHELRVYNEVSAKHCHLSYYRTPAGVEIDFIIETARRRAGNPPRVVAIETKRAARWDRAWNKPMRNLAGTAGVKVERMIGVYCGSRIYRFGDIEILPLEAFLDALFSGDVF